VGAQEPAPAVAPSPFIDRVAGLSLADAIGRAREQEPALRATRSDVDVARGLRQQSALRPNPSTTFEGRREPGGTDSLLSIGVEWPLDLFRRAGRVATADRQVEASRWALADRERLLDAEVRAQYGRAAAAIRDAEVAAELATTVERQLAVSRARADEGAAPRLDADLLEVELRRLQSQHAIALGRAERAVLGLKPLLGLEPGEPLTLREPLDVLVAAHAAAVAPIGRLATAVAERADVRAAAEQVAVADARIDQARREGRVDLSLMASYMRMDAGFPQLGLSAAGVPERVRSQFQYVSVGATVMLPILNRNQGQVVVARAERDGAEARRRAAELTAAAERAAAAARDTGARMALAAFGETARTLARRNLDAVRQTFALGRGTMSDVLAEHRRYLELENTYTATLLEAWEAQVDMERASGESK
jgi:cobalt-zinc-cadmium efflux system outer membrane protein